MLIGSYVSMRVLINCIRSISVFFLMFPWFVEAKPQVVASIKPLALIAQAVAGSRAEVETLLPIAASPHDYPLKVSDHRRLRAADLVLWVGPELESFLQRSLANLPAHKIMAAYSLSGLNWPEAADHPAEAEHQHSGGDPHLWLDPRNAAVIALAVAAKLAELDPAAAEDYRANAQRFSASLEQLDRDLMQQMHPLKHQGFAVYHEGYGHFVHRYSLRQLGYVTYSPERRPGARHLKELQTILEAEGKCMFVEPYYKVEAAESMAKSLGLRIGTLDPIGNQQVSSYTELLKNMGKSFSTCLADQ